MILTCRKQWEADLPIIDKKLSDSIKTKRVDGNVIGTAEVMVFNEETNGIQCLSYVKKGQVKSIKIILLNITIIALVHIQKMSFCTLKSNGTCTRCTLIKPIHYKHMH